MAGRRVWRGGGGHLGRSMALVWPKVGAHGGRLRPGWSPARLRPEQQWQWGAAPAPGHPPRPAPTTPPVAWSPANSRAVYFVEALIYSFDGPFSKVLSSVEVWGVWGRRPGPGPAHPHLQPTPTCSEATTPARLFVDDFFSNSDKGIHCRLTDSWKLVHIQSLSSE